MQAWEKAYGVIADAFIGIEKDMYEQAEEQARSFATQSAGKAKELAERFLQLGQEAGQPSTNRLADSVPLSNQEGTALSTLIETATGKAKDAIGRLLRLGQPKRD